MAVHCNAVPVAVRETEPVPPEAGTFADVGLTVRVPPDCVTVIVVFGPLEGLPVMVAVRDAPVGFGAAVNWKLPLPVPDAGETVSHVESLVIVQLMVWSVTDTWTAPLPPAASALALAGVNEIRGLLEDCSLRVNT